MSSGNEFKNSQVYKQKTTNKEMFYSGLSKLFTSKNTPEHKLFPIPNGKSKKSINKRTEWLRAISIEGNQSVDLSVSDIFSKVGPCMNQ